MQAIYIKAGLWGIGVLALLWPEQALAQEKRWSMGVNLFPNLTSVQITSNGSLDPKAVKTTREAFIASPAISVQSILTYRWKSKAHVWIGLGYQKNGPRTKDLSITYFPEPPLTEHITSTQFIYHYHQLELPLGLNYYLGKRIYGTLGSSVTYNLDRSIIRVSNYSSGREERKGETLSTDNFKRFNVLANLGFGVEVVQKDQFQICLQPSGQYHLVGLFKEGNLNHHPWAVGLATGVRF